jgi:hypothetical protein
MARCLGTSRSKINFSRRCRAVYDWVEPGCAYLSDSVYPSKL